MPFTHVHRQCCKLATSAGLTGQQSSTIPLLGDHGSCEAWVQRGVHRCRSVPPVMSTQRLQPAHTEPAGMLISESGCVRRKLQCKRRSASRRIWQGCTAASMRVFNRFTASHTARHANLATFTKRLCIRSTEVRNKPGRLHCIVTQQRTGTHVRGRTQVATDRQSASTRCEKSSPRKRGSDQFK